MRSANLSKFSIEATALGEFDSPRGFTVGFAQSRGEALDKAVEYAESIANGRTICVEWDCQRKLHVQVGSWELPDTEVVEIVVCKGV